MPCISHKHPDFNLRRIWFIKSLHTYVCPKPAEQCVYRWKWERICVCVLVRFSRKSIAFIHNDGNIYLKEFVHVIMEAGKFKICRVQNACQSGDQRKSWWCSASLKAVCSAPPCSWSGDINVLFYSGLELIRWGPPMLCRAICFTQNSPISMLLSCKSILTETFRTIVGPLSGHHVSAKLTHKTNHHWVQAGGERKVITFPGTQIQIAEIFEATAVMETQFFCALKNSLNDHFYVVYFITI